MPFNFSASPKLRLHLRAQADKVWQDTARTVQAGNGDPVGSWESLVGSTHLTRTTGSATRPKFVADDGNGRPCIQFTVGEWLDWPAAFFAGRTQGHIVSVHRKSAAGNGNLWTLGSTGSAQQYTFNGSVGETFGTSVRKSCGVPVADLAVPHVYSVASEPGRYRVWLNGSPLHESPQNTVGWSTSPLISNTLTFSGDWYELLFFDPILTEDEHTSLVAQLRTAHAIEPTTEAPQFPSIHTGDFSVRLRDSHGYLTTEVVQPSTGRNVAVDNSGNGTVIKHGGTWHGPAHDTVVVQERSIQVNDAERPFPQASYSGHRVAYSTTYLLGAACRVHDEYQVNADREIKGRVSFDGIAVGTTIEVFYARLFARETRFGGYAAYDSNGALLASGTMLTGTVSDVTLPTGTRTVLQYDSATGDLVSMHYGGIDSFSPTVFISGDSAYRKLYLRLGYFETTADRIGAVTYGQGLFNGLDQSSFPPENPNSYLVTVTP